MGKFPLKEMYSHFLGLLVSDLQENPEKEKEIIDHYAGELESNFIQITSPKQKTEVSIPLDGLMDYIVKNSKPIGQKDLDKSSPQ